MNKRPRTLVCYICGREYGTASLGIHIKSCQQKWEQQQMLLPRNQRRPLPSPPPGLAQLMGQNKMKMNDVDNFNEQAFDTYNQESLVKCPYCNRTFNQDRIDVHRRICTRDKPFKPLPGAGMEMKQQKQMYEQYPSRQQQQQQQKQPIKGKQKYDFNEYDDEFESYPIYQKGQLKQKKQDYYEEQYQKPSKAQPQKGILKKGKPQTYNEPEEYNYSGGGAMLMPCQYCGRKFNPDRIDKHQNACRKMKKRFQFLFKKIFKQARKIKYFGAFGKKAGPPIKQKPMKKPPSKWRKEHEEFISGLRAARQYSSKNSMQPQSKYAGGQGKYMGGMGGGGGQSKYQSQYQFQFKLMIIFYIFYRSKPQSSYKASKYPKQQQQYDDDYDPFAYKPKAPSTQKQVYRKQFDYDAHQAPPTVKTTTKKSNTTTKKNQYKPHEDIQISGGGGGGGSYLERLEQQYKSKNVAARPAKSTKEPAVQFVGGASKFNQGNSGMGGGGGGAMDPTSNAHSRNLIFADSGHANTYQSSYQDQWQTTYSGAYSGSKQKQNAFSVPGQQKTYVDAPYQTQQNQGAVAAYQQYNQRQQPKGYKYDF